MTASWGIAKKTASEKIGEKCFLSSHFAHIFVIRILSSAFCHPHFVIRILSSAFCQPHFVIRILSAAFCHPHFVSRNFLSAIRHPPSAIRRHPVRTLQTPKYYWNALPVCIRDLTTKTAFKKALRKYYLAQY